jgi:hypothetical protein
MTRKFQFTRARAILLSAIVVATVEPLHASAAQQSAALHAGVQVRLSVAPPNPRVEGRVVSLTPTGLVVAEGKSTVPVEFASIRMIEVRKRTAGSFFRSVAYGLLGGVVTGAVVGAAQGNVNTGDGTYTTGDNAIIGSVVGGFFGILGGTVFGACCASSWQAVPIPAS